MLLAEPDEAEDPAYAVTLPRVSVCGVSSTALSRAFDICKTSATRVVQKPATSGLVDLFKPAPQWVDGLAAVRLHDHVTQARRLRRCEANGRQPTLPIQDWRQAPEATARRAHGPRRRRRHLRASLAQVDAGVRRSQEAELRRPARALDPVDDHRARGALGRCAEPITTAPGQGRIVKCETVARAALQGRNRRDPTYLRDDPLPHGLTVVRGMGPASLHATSRSQVVQALSASIADVPALP